MKRFVLKLIKILLPTLAFVVSINYFGDAANLFSRDFEKNIANELIKGNIITNVYNYDERLFEKHLISNLNSCTDVAVFGSSRVMLIGSDHFKNKTFINNGVSGASLEDLISIYQLYKQKKCLPKSIILGLDPWTLNINNGLTRWLTLKEEYYKLHYQLTHTDIPLKNEQFDQKYLELVSPSYFQSSLKKMFSDSTMPIITKSKINKTFTRLPDGSVTYDLSYRVASPTQIKAAAQSFVSNDIYCIEKFDKLSPELISLLELFIAQIKNDKVDVSFFLTPYHPTVYSFIENSKKYSQVLASEKYYNSLAIKYDIKVIGSYDPDKSGLNDSCFYDGMHCNEKGIDKLLNNN